jgi:hypothetical protein
MMKIFVTILSLFILVLTAIPCIDAPTHSLQKSELNNSNAEHHESEDDCSPFCTCVCCASPMIQGFLSVQINGLGLVEEYSSAYKSIRCNSLASSIWQPPKQI